MIYYFTYKTLQNAERKENHRDRSEAKSSHRGGEETERGERKARKRTRTERTESPRRGGSNVWLEEQERELESTNANRSKCRPGAESSDARGETSASGSESEGEEENERSGDASEARVGRADGSYQRRFSEERGRRGGRGGAEIEARVGRARGREAKENRREAKTSERVGEEAGGDATTRNHVVVRVETETRRRRVRPLRGLPGRKYPRRRLRGRGGKRTSV